MKSKSIKDLTQDIAGIKKKLAAAQIGEPDWVSLRAKYQGLAHSISEAKQANQDFL